MAADTQSASVPVPALAERARVCADRLLAADRVLVASHIDADGLTSAAVAATALERAGLAVEVVFKNQLDAHEIATIAAREVDTVLFTDFGSGQLDDILEHAAGAFDPVVVDHHQPVDVDAAFEHHLNPLLAGIDGASELSGAGATYLLARALDAHTGGDSRDLAALAVVGAVGDMQASGGELHGANAAIVEDGVAADVLETATDLALYGRQTRPLPKLLEYASDVHIPGISGDEAGSVGFLSDLELDLRLDGDWRRWVDLTLDERATVVNALMRRALKSGVPADRVETLVGTTYELTDEEPGTELRDASEFSTLLNATARYERADVGLAVCLGDRGPALDRARRLLRNHRRRLSEGVEWVEQQGLTHETNLQWFDAGDEIRETIVGIVAGMAIEDDDIPIVAFAAKSDEKTKVSARGTPGLVRQGLDLSTVMDEVATAVGGKGGGHDVAAGATIPTGTETAFIERADAVVGAQLG